MNKEIKSDTWIWVGIQDPGTNEQFLGQLDEDKNESYIPAFYQKEDAQQFLIQLKTEKGKNTKFRQSALTSWPKMLQKIIL